MSRPSGKPFAAAISCQRVMVKVPGSAHKHGGPVSVDATDFVHGSNGRVPVVLLFGAKPMLAIP